MVLQWDTMVLFKVSETCDYLKPRRRNPIERGILMMKGQRELIKELIRRPRGKSRLYIT